MADIRQFRIFLAIWETRSFSRAAEQVHLTQPTVSAHIKALEEQLGVTLFDRKGRQVVPTRAAKRLFPMARQIVRLASQAEEEMRRFSGESGGTLEIGGSNIPGQYILPALLGRFKKDHPDITIRLQIGDTAAIIAAVESSSLELGMVGAVMDKRRLVFTPCFQDELVLAVPEGHPFWGRSHVLPEELPEGVPFVIREAGSGTRATFERGLAGLGLQVSRLNIVAEMGSTEAIRQAVKSGVGLAVISSRSVKDELANGALWACRIKGLPLKRNFYLVWHSMRTPAPVTMLFRRFLLEQGGCTEGGEGPGESREGA